MTVEAVFTTEIIIIATVNTALTTFLTRQRATEWRCLVRRADNLYSDTPSHISLLDRIFRRKIVAMSR